MKTENYEHEDLIPKCIEIIKAEQRASVSLLQRRLKLGYMRAASIMDELENRGIVGPAKGAEPREILISKQTVSKYGHQIGTTCKACDCVIDHFGCGCNHPDA